MPGITGLSDLIEQYFSSRIWLIVFIASVVYLLFRINGLSKRALCAVVIVFFLIVNSFVINVFTKLGENSTFYRHLWAIPSMTIIGIAIVDLIRVLPRWYLKLSTIIALAFGLWLINGQEYIRCRDLYFSIDAKMVSEDIIELGDELERLQTEARKRLIVASTEDKNELIRLYNGNIKIFSTSILSTDELDGDEAVSIDYPNVEQIMSRGCIHGIDYVIVSRREHTEETFETEGYEPTLITENYILYECKGYAGWTQDLTNFDKVKWLQYHDENGNIALCPDGYAKVVCQYDKKGHLISECYYNELGELIEERLTITETNGCELKPSPEKGSEAVEEN